jgi:hypothetical protein
MASVSGAMVFSGWHFSASAPTVWRSHSSRGSSLTWRVLTQPIRRPESSSTGYILKW